MWRANIQLCTSAPMKRGRDEASGLDTMKSMRDALPDDEMDELVAKMDTVLKVSPDPWVERIKLRFSNVRQMYTSALQRRCPDARRAEMTRDIDGMIRVVEDLLANVDAVRRDGELIVIVFKNSKDRVYVHRVKDELKIVRYSIGPDIPLPDVHAIQTKMLVEFYKKRETVYADGWDETGATWEDAEKIGIEAFQRLSA